MARRRVNNGELRREERKSRAEVRQKIADERSPYSQVARLDKLFGPGKGAKKEREKLALRMAGVVTNAQPAKVVSLQDELSALQIQLNKINALIDKGYKRTVERDALQRKIAITKKALEDERHE